MRTRPLCDLSVQECPEPTFLDFDTYSVLHPPGQCICPYFVHTTVLIAKAIIERDPVVEPKEAPPVPKSELYIAMSVAISVSVRSRRITLPKIAHGTEEQQDFIEKGGIINVDCTIIFNYELGITN